MLHITKPEEALIDQIDDYTVIAVRSASIVNERASAVVGRAVRGDVLLFKRCAHTHSTHTHTHSLTQHKHNTPHTHTQTNIHPADPLPRIASDVYQAARSASV